jgi:L-fuculose-phosphate aldolase
VATTNEHTGTEASPAASSDWIEERRAVLDAAKAMYADGLVAGTSGNVSVRCGRGELLAITSAGKDYDTLAIDQIVVVDFDGEPVVGDDVPSTEMLMHIAIYRARPDASAVMHTHSIYASAMAVANIAIPPIVDEMVVSLGGAIEVSGYAFPSTEELGDAVVAALGERNAALIRNHGLVGVGASAGEALRACRMAERAAHVYVVASALGNPESLPTEAVETELALFRMRRQAEAQS